MSRLSRSQLSTPTLASLAASASAPSTSEDPTATQDKANVVRRVMEKTADKLNRSKSLERRGPQGPSSKQPASPRRVFSLTRKGKEKQPVDDGAFHHASLDLICAHTFHCHLMCAYKARSSTRSKRSSPSTPSEPDESPFIRPPSPTHLPRRPSLQPFTGDGSVSTCSFYSYIFSMCSAGLLDTMSRPKAKSASHTRRSLSPHTLVTGGPARGHAQVGCNILSLVFVLSPREEDI